MAELKAIDIDLEVNGVIENSRRSFSESQNDILRRILLSEARPGRRVAVTEPTPSKSAAQIAEVPPQGTRTTGRWTVELCGERQPCPNLKEAYRAALLMLNARYPNFLEKFAQKGGRGRRFIAKAPAQLYLSSPALAAKHAAPLKNGWFFDSNLSTDQVSRRVRIAAAICGLGYGKDFRLLNNFQEI